nr:hypothetical protein BaRGS_000137 [Batillaria attramentaria]
MVSPEGLMFGYATDETEELMPLTIMLSHKLNAKIAELRHSGELWWARPDTKTQVTVEYRIDQGATVPIRVHTIVISAQHEEAVTLEQLRQDLMELVVRPVIPAKYLDANTVYHIQPSGRFIIGGPQGDAGLTGRKIIVDTYGGWGAHGGGALSGKDPAQIDRCASYAARWIAKSLVAAGLCRRVLVQVSYSMGVTEPLSVMVFSYGTSKLSHARLLEVVKKNFDLRPGKIVTLAIILPLFECHLNLLTDITRRLSGPKLADLYVDLKVQDKHEAALKKLRVEGMDKDGMREAQVNAAFRDITDNEVEGAKKRGRSQEEMKELEHNLKSQSKDIRAGYYRLEDMISEFDREEPEFRDHRVYKLWALAKKTDWSPEELESFKEELLHFERRLQKHEHYEDQLMQSADALRDQVKDGKYPEKHAQLEQRTQELRQKVKKMHDELKTRVSKAFAATQHTEL